MEGGACESVGKVSTNESYWRVVCGSTPHTMGVFNQGTATAG